MFPSWFEMVLRGGFFSLSFSQASCLIEDVSRGGLFSFLLSSFLIDCRCFLVADSFSLPSLELLAWLKIISRGGSSSLPSFELLASLKRVSYGGLSFLSFSCASCTIEDVFKWGNFFRCVLPSASFEMVSWCISPLIFLSSSSCDAMEKTLGGYQ